MPKAMSVTGGKPDAMGRQRKEAIKTGRAHKVSNQETRQKPIATGKVSALKMPPTRNIAYGEMFPSGVLIVL